MVRKYLAEVTRELEAPEATMFRFKGVGGGRRGGEKMGDKVQARVGEVLRQSKAGAFAEMVVKGARVGYASRFPRRGRRREMLADNGGF